MALTIADEVEEQFELLGASTPCLRGRALLEARMAAPGKHSEPPAGSRRLALGQVLKFFVSAIAQGLEDGAAHTAFLQKLWFDSMHTCDILAARGLDFVGPDTMPHAAAVLRILWKVEDAMRTLPSDYLSKLTTVLVVKHGVAMQPALPQDIDSAETRILHRLGWQVWSPSLHWWLTAFFSRLRLLTKQQLTDQEESEFGAAMTQLWHDIYTWGTALVMCVASLGLSAPRSLAMGLLGLGCVRAGMLQLHSVGPELLGAAEWAQVYRRAVGPVPAVKGDSHADTIAQIIQLSTDSSMCSVKDACWRVAVVVSDARMRGSKVPGAASEA